jgi:REP element-mobilizing transposase RayT
VAIAKDPIVNRQKRRSIRLQSYDYSRAGAYYITVCTRNRECLFGNVVNGQMQLNEAGRILQPVWEGLPQFYEGIELDAVVVMPNHLHGIVIICAAVGAIHESPLRPEPPESVRVADRRRMLLSKVVGRFKMVSAKQVNDLRQTSGKALWQRNYYEHIVRDEESLNRIRQYIADNPAQWEFDRENPALIASRGGNS